ncbi:MAG: hypothetical protein Kow0042_24400 [Calditrichia bacterium]
MKKNFYFQCLIILSVLILLSGCEIQHSPEITDLIPPVSLKSGVEDTLRIDDLFYAENYNLSFLPHKEIGIKYDPRQQLLMLKPSQDYEGLTFIDFQFHGDTFSIPLNITRLYKHTFRLKPAGKYERIQLFGSFNSWNRESLRLKDPDNDGIFEITVPLEPGRYEYKYWVDGEEILDPENPLKVPNPFGSYNSLLEVAPQWSFRPFLHLLEWKRTTNNIQLKFYLESEDNLPFPIAENVLALIGNKRLSTNFITAEGNRIDLLLPKSTLNGKKIVRVAANRGGQCTFFQTVRLWNGEPFGRRGAPTTWYDAVMYSIMIDRFSDGDPSNNRPVVHPELSPKANFMGGDLQGILNKLREGYFEALGINVLWLSPLNQNPDKAYREYPPPHRYFAGYHGYWPIHHEHIDGRFGNWQLFRQLVQEAHDRGIRLILDFVANHVHQDHPFYQQHPDWFGQLELPDGRKNIRFWDEYRLTTWFEPFLPSFDYLGSREALETMTDNALWWIKNSGIDGFRQDAVKHVPNKFWRRLTQKIKKEIEAKEKREIFQIGETFGSYQLIRSYVNNGQLNSQFNFNLYDVALPVFLEPNMGFETLDSEMQKTFEVYGMNHLMGNVMNSHDKIRYMAYADGDIRLGEADAAEIGWSNPPHVDDPRSYQKARLFLTYVLTIPGVPVIYYGDEIGMTGAADPDNRRPMRFGEDLQALEKQMLEEVRKIVHWRREHSALRYGDFYPLLAEKDVYAFLRSDFNERILVILNKSDAVRRVKLQLPGFYQLVFAKNLYTGVRWNINDNVLELEVSPFTGEVYQLK